jgi:hypothetical protein
MTTITGQDLLVATLALLVAIVIATTIIVGEIRKASGTRKPSPADIGYRDAATQDARHEWQ